MAGLDPQSEKQQRCSLARRLLAQTTYLGNGLIKASGFLNHRIDTALMTDIGQEFAHHLSEEGITGISLVVTAETSGIAPALTTAQALGVPVVFARKKRPATMAGECFTAAAPSHTKGQMVELSISTEYLSAADRVLLIDDFLGTGKTSLAMLELLRQSGCHVCAIGFVLEKVYEQGREAIGGVNVPVFALARLDLQEGKLVLVETSEVGDRQS